MLNGGRERGRQGRQEGEREREREREREGGEGGREKERGRREGERDKIIGKDTISQPDQKHYQCEYHCTVQMYTPSNYCPLSMP